MKHRSDIDGLRALAVGGVVLGHAGVPFLPAGFVGVDVFFVISGFLIGSILMSQLEQGMFTLSSFYAKRVWRIFPALYVMISVTLVAGWFLLTPHELRYLGGAAIATLAFASNLWFYNQIDYFTPDAKYEPLLHTWSLGVEEQFYIVIPLVLMGLMALVRRSKMVLRMLAFGVLAALALASFAYALGFGADDPQALFYLPLTRSFELILGVLAAIILPKLVQPNAFVRAALVLAGAATILASYVFISESALWPSAVTLIPIAGTLAVLVYGGASLRGCAVLGARPLAALGVISYSVYLWHQPLLSYAILYGYDSKQILHVALFCIATLGLSFVSWKYVEQPFRYGAFGLNLRRMLLAGLAFVIVAFAVGGHITKGYPARMSPEVLEALSWKTSYSSTYRNCIGTRKDGGKLEPAYACVHGAEVAPTVAMWGDSHAAILSSPLGQELGSHGLALLELTVGSCIPVIGLKNTNLKRSEYCAEHNQKMLEYILDTPTLETVVLHSYWNSYVEWRDFDNRIGWTVEDKVVALPLEASTSMPQDARLQAISMYLERQVTALLAAGKTVVVLGPLPAAGFEAAEWRARAIWANTETPIDMSYPRAAFENYSALTWALFDTLQANEKLRLVDLTDAFCPSATGCEVISNGVPLHFDDNHLSLAGVARVVGPLAEAIMAP